MDVILRAAGVAIAALSVLLVLRGVTGNFAVFVKIAAVLLLFGMAILELSHGVSSIRETVFAFIDSESFVGTAISVMVKPLGIALVGRICADICRECGEGGLAQGVEAVAGGVIFSLSLPILSEILEFASDVLAQGS